MDESETVVCPAYNAEQAAADALMGTLGQREHFRCRDCGMEFSREAPPAEKGGPGDE